MSSLLDTPVEEVRNLGPVSGRWLSAVGIRTRRNLERVGSIEAYLLVRQSLKERKPSLNLLFAMEAALCDIHWTDFPADVKRELRAAIR